MCVCTVVCVQLGRSIDFAITTARSIDDDRVMHTSGSRQCVRSEQETVRGIWNFFNDHRSYLMMMHCIASCALLGSRVITVF